MKYNILLKKLTYYAFFVAILSITPFAFNSCASAPRPGEDKPITGSTSIPIPTDTNDEVIPDPVDNQDINNSSENTPPVMPTTPTAKPVPGRPGFVFNPYTQNMVDVEGIPSRTKVRDPQDSDESHTFYVP